MERDPFQILMDAGSSQETALLLGAPVALLGIVAIVYLVLFLIKRKREAEDLTKAVEEEEQRSGQGS